MSERTTTDYESASHHDDLAVHVKEIEAGLERADFDHVVRLIESDTAATWFGLSPSRSAEIMQLLLHHVSADSRLLQVVRGFFRENSAGGFDTPEFLSTFNFDDPREVYILTMLRMGSARLQGRTHDALEQCDLFEHQLGQMQPLVDSHDSWVLHATVQMGITAMLAGQFTRALTNFTRAQLHVQVPKFGFLTRDALAKSALIHACFGNRTTARSLILRADKITRTSSWAEDHVDAHRDFAEVLVSTDDYDEALEKLEAINLHDIGEMWPFYILAVHRVLEAGGHQDELEHQMQMFDSMPFPRQDGDGFAGSIIPLKCAALALKNGRGVEAQSFIDRADPQLSYTRLFQAAAHVYAGRTQQAIQEVSRLRAGTRGFRLMEVRRLAILAAAQYQADEDEDCIATLKRAAEIPRGLGPLEVQLFSPETRELAAKKVPSWPRDNNAPSVFLNGLPKPGLALTEREVEIIEHLAKGHPRAHMAEKMYISVNTLKTHLKAIYRKLGVSSAKDAVLGAQRRGLL